MFHLGWFLGTGFGIQPWNSGANVAVGSASPTSGAWNGNAGREWMKPQLYVDLAVSLERAGFDYILIEDTSMIEDSYGDSMEMTLKYGLLAPKNDPMPLVPFMTAATRRIGIVPTISTTYYHPYMAARLMTTLDHVTDGRIGMNVVTSVSDRGAQNYGHKEHIEHDLRYAMAEEWMDVVSALWESWEPDAVLLDEERNIYADHTKVHPINFEGRWYASRGPLNTIPGPQRRPVIAQAGNSGPGRDLAARNADTMLAHCSTPEKMIALREDMHERLEKFGRKPEDLKILFLVTPVIGNSDAEAAAMAEAIVEGSKSDDSVQATLWGLSYTSGGRIDFSKLNLDEPMPDVIGNGEQSSLRSFVEAGKAGKTLRETISGHQLVGDLGLVGSPDTVAVKMGELMRDVGGDGFLLYSPVNRRAISEIADGLAPALRRRGLIRDGYGNGTFRDNLLEF